MNKIVLLETKWKVKPDLIKCNEINHPHTSRAEEDVKKTAMSYRI